MEEVIDWHSIPRGSAFTFVGMPSDVDIVYYLGRSLVTPLIAILESESGAIYKKPLAVLRHWPEHDKRAQPAVDEALKALETAYRAQTLSDDWVLGIGHAFLAHGDVIVATLRDQKQPPQTVAGDEAREIIKALAVNIQVLLNVIDDPDGGSALAKMIIVETAKNTKKNAD